MSRIALTGLLKIELPDRTLRYSDAGFFELDGEVYRDEDDVYGTIGALKSTDQSVGNLIQSIILTLLPASDATPAQISTPGNQTSPAELTIAEYDADTGAIIDTDVEYTGQIDQTVLTSSADTRELAVSIVSLMERAFQTNNGNYQSSAFHKSIWPNETGHDDATGLVIDDAWGTESQGGNLEVFSRGGGKPPTISPRARFR